MSGVEGAEVWLFGSLARGGWDARSDVDLLATGLVDDVIGLSQERWLQHQQGVDPWWRGICRDAIRLQPCQKP